MFWHLGAQERRGGPDEQLKPCDARARPIAAPKQEPRWHRASGAPPNFGSHSRRCRTWCAWRRGRQKELSSRDRRGHGDSGQGGSGRTWPAIRLLSAAPHSAKWVRTQRPVSMSKSPEGPGTGCRPYSRAAARPVFPGESAGDFLLLQTSHVLRSQTRRSGAGDSAFTSTNRGGIHDLDDTTWTDPRHRRRRHAGEHAVHLLAAMKLHTLSRWGRRRGSPSKVAKGQEHALPG